MSHSSASAHRAEARAAADISVAEHIRHRILGITPFSRCPFSYWWHPPSMLEGKCSGYMEKALVYGRASAQSHRKSCRELHTAYSCILLVRQCICNLHGLRSVLCYRGRQVIDRSEVGTPERCPDPVIIVIAIIMVGCEDLPIGI